MRNFFLLLAFCGLALSPVAGAATNQGALAVVARGFSAYQESGASSAIKAWLKGSPLEGLASISSDKNKLNTLQHHIGKFTGYEVSRVHQLSQRVVMIFAVANFEQGPVFFKFVIYNTQKKGWVLNSYQFGAAPDKVWPYDMVYGNLD